MQEPLKIIKTRLSYQGRKFNFEVSQLQLPNGVEGEWECIRHPGGSLVIPVTNKGELVLVKQYRFALETRLLEFPAGTIEIGETAESTVKREIEEESGFRGHSWQYLGKFPLAPGYSDEYIYAYLAKDLEKLETPPEQDEDEDIEVVFMSPQQLETAIRQGELIDAKTIASFYLALPFLQ